MTRTCTVCNHKDIEEINRRLINKESYRDIAGQYKLSKSAVERHFNGNPSKNEPGHIPELLSKSNDIKEIVTADSLLKKVKDEEDFVREMRVLAASEGDIKVALSAVDRALKCIELYARVLGIIKDQPQITLQQISIYQSPEWLDVGDVLDKVLSPYPDLKIEVAERLLSLEKGEMRC